MNIRIYNVVTRDGYILDKTGEHFLYFTADKKEFLSLYKTADCLLLDYEHYEYLTRVGVLPATKKFVIVVTDQPTPKGMENIWFTNLDVKQIKREIKIQGYDDVLCLLNNSMVGSMLVQKVATELHIAIFHDIEGGGIEKIEFSETIKKKYTPKKTQGKDWERLNYTFKK